MFGVLFISMEKNFPKVPLCSPGAGDASCMLFPRKMAASGGGIS